MTTNYIRQYDIKQIKLTDGTTIDSNQKSDTKLVK